MWKAEVEQVKQFVQDPHRKSEAQWEMEKKIILNFHFCALSVRNYPKRVNVMNLGGRGSALHVLQQPLWSTLGMEITEGPPGKLHPVFC